MSLSDLTNGLQDLLGGAAAAAGYQPSAIDSVRNLMGEGSTSDRLQFPITLGTDKHSHMVVFHIYDGGGAETYDMKDKEWTDAQNAEGKMMNSGIMGGAIGAGAGLYGANRLAKRLGKGGWNRYSLLLQAAGGLGGWLLGQKTGEAITELNLTKKEKEALQKKTDIDENILKNYVKRSDQLFKETGRTARFGEALNKTKDTIALYMPQKIQSLSLLDYEQQDMSFMQNLINDWTGLVAKGLITKSAQAIDSLASFVSMNTNVDAYLLAGARIAPNPRKQLMFREPVSRKFELNFNFSPRNAEESVRAYQIIKRFKKYAYPTLSSKYGKGAFYTFPAEFEIEYHSINEFGEAVQNDWINKIGRCALREINVDYASSGSFSTFENGAPTNMLMSLTFEEMSLLDSGSIEEGY